MISALIFSKDRACQLHLLLESLWLNADYLYLFNPTVLYTASTPLYQRGYDRLMQFVNDECGPLAYARFLRENHFTTDVLEIVEQSFFDHICCFTDDGIFYRNPAIEYRDLAEQMTDDVACFSFRIGLNTTIERYWDGTPTPPLMYSDFGPFIKWNHKAYPGDTHFGYPGSLDGHVFRKDDFVGMLKRLGNFTGPNNLEGALCRFKQEMPPNMVALKQSCLFVNPVNRVQDVCQNVNGRFHGISTQELNERYLAGQVIDLEAMDFSAVVGTHQEFPLTFKQA